MKTSWHYVAALLVSFAAALTTFLSFGSYWSPSQIASEAGSGATARIAGADSGPASLSSNGRYVAFTTSSTNLGGKFGSFSVYVRDTCTSIAQCTGSLTFVDPQVCSVAGIGERPSISSSGRYVAFSAVGCQFALVNNNTNTATNQWQVFLQDTCVGAANCTPSTIEITNASAPALTGTPGSHFPSISADGKYIAFLTTADILNNNIPANDFQIYVADVSGCEPPPTQVPGTNWSSCLPPLRPISHQGSATSTSLDGACTQPFISINANFPCAPQISPDGRFVAFISNAQSLKANGHMQLFVGDQCFTGGNPVANCTPEAYGPLSLFNGTQANADVTNPSIANLGRFVTFSSTAQLTSISTQGNSQIYIADDCTPWAPANNCSSIRLVSTPDGTTAANAPSTEPAIDAAADTIFFASIATNLLPADNGIYRATLCTPSSSCCTPAVGAGVLITAGSLGIARQVTQLNGTSSWPVPSADSSALVFVSNATNIGFAPTPSSAQLVYSASFNRPSYTTVTLPFPFCFLQVWHLALIVIVILIWVVYRRFGVNRNAARNAS